MKILFTMPDIDKEASGPSYSVTRLAESLIECGEDVQVALIGQGENKSYIRAFPPGMGPARLGNSPAMHRWLAQQMKTGAVDVVHNHSLWMLPNVYPGWVTKGRKVPYVVSPRGTLSEWAMSSGSKIKRVFWPLIQKPSITHAACFHATAESEYEDIRRMGFKQPVAIIPNGIDLPEYQKKMDRNHRRTLLFLGRLHPVKGIDFLLRAWKILQDLYPEWDLRIVGPDNTDNAVALKAMANQLELRRVEFSGAIYGAAKFDAYRAADLYVLPTHSENFGMTVAEALACATPVVVSQGAPWSGLEQNGAGWWPEIGYEPLLSVLQSAMSLSSAELDTMGENGRRWVQNDFSWASIGHNMQATYRWLLGKGDKPACVETA
jgi:glycosyltransferase involved in cell wall biosynthesis